MGEHNAAIREDHPGLASSAATLSRGINALCLQGRGAGDLPFPPAGVTYRGGGFDDAHRAFFEAAEGEPPKQYRAPGFVAASFLPGVAERFRRTAEAYGHRIELDAASDNNPAAEGGDQGR